MSSIKLVENRDPFIVNSRPPGRKRTPSHKLNIWIRCQLNLRKFVTYPHQYPNGATHLPTTPANDILIPLPIGVCRIRPTGASAFLKVPLQLAGNEHPMVVLAEQPYPLGSRAKGKTFKSCG